MSTLTCPLPSNINPLSPNGFLFNITKLPDVNFFSQQVNIPSVSLGAPEQGTPFLMVPLPGEMLTFGSLELQFIVDEDMKNYTAIFNWMKGLGFPHDYANILIFKSKMLWDLLDLNYQKICRMVYYKFLIVLIMLYLLFNLEIYSLSI